jgi:iron complex transport system ATP-binding protein
MLLQPVIEMRRVTITKGRTTILRDVNLRIDRGERVVILGPNGSGKSSLIKTMTGDNRFDTSVEGASVRIRGKEEWSLFDIRRAFGMVSGDLQYEFYRDLTSLEAVISGFFGSVGTNRSQDVTEDMRDAAVRSLSCIGISHLAKRTMSTLSTGEARRVLIARALVNDPEALILDEPMSSLDLTGKYHVRSSMHTLAESGRTIILVTHDPSDIISEINRVIMMRDGSIFRDGGLELINEDLLSMLYGVEVGVRMDKGRFFAWS